MPEFAWLQWLVTTGHLADIAMVALLVEAAIMLTRNARQRFVIVFNTASGLALMAALRSAMTSASSTWIAIFLSLGFLAHLGELAARNRASSPAPRD